MTQQLKWRLGIDLGTQSIGWAVVKMANEPNALVAAGSHIFSDGLDDGKNASLAVDRTRARSARRNRWRDKRRMAALKKYLTEFGLMPKDPQKARNILQLQHRNPYKARADAAIKQVDNHTLGRAIWHLAKRRGFKSNRKSDAQDTKLTQTKKEMEQTQTDLQQSGYETLGAYLYHRLENNKPARARHYEVPNEPENEPYEADYQDEPQAPTKSKTTRLIYPTRKMFEEEFEVIRTKQQSQLTEDQWKTLYEIIFNQRPLKPVPVGKCSILYEQGKDRAMRALPIFQRFRILQDLAHASYYPEGEFESRKFTGEEFKKLFQKLLTTNELKETGMKKILDGGSFKLKEKIDPKTGTPTKQPLKGDETAAKLRNKNIFAKGWDEKSAEDQTAIVKKLIDSETGDEALKNLAIGEWELDENQAEKLVAANLPASTAQFCEEVLEKICQTWEDTAHWQNDRMPTYNEALEMAGYGDHSNLDESEPRDLLPYYGELLARHVVEAQKDADGNPKDKDQNINRYGRIQNVTVHIVLNQLRKLLNALIKKYGKPSQITIETARDVSHSPKKRNEIEKQIATHTKEREKRKEEIAKILGIDEDAVKPRDIDKYQLWEQQNEMCIYSGAKISREEVLTGAVEIDHILPQSKTGDNSKANLVLCTREANRAKAGRSPYDAFGLITSGDYSYQKMLERVNCNDKIPNSKKWRFGKDAMENSQDFTERNLNDTKYASRIALGYLKPICTDPNAVWATPGKFTGLLRRHWGLNSVLVSMGHNLPDQPEVSPAKNRNDHRHHAIDAVVIALTDRRKLQGLSTAFKAQEDATAKGERVKINIAPPWENFRTEVQQKAEGITVSHRQDTAIDGQLHQETHYGLVKNPEKEGHQLVTRKPIMSLTKGDISRIRDKKLREELEQATRGDGDLKTAIQQYLDHYQSQRKDSATIRHIRIFPFQQEGAISLEGEKYKDSLGKQHKRVFMPADNWCVDIYKNENGEYRGEPINRFEANNHYAKHNKPPEPKPKDGEKFVVRIFKGNYLKINGKIYCVRKINPSANRLGLIPHNEAGMVDKRVADKSDHLKWTFLTFSHFGKKQVQKLHIDILGNPSNAQTNN